MLNPTATTCCVAPTTTELFFLSLSPFLSLLRSRWKVEFSWIAVLLWRLTVWSVETTKGLQEKAPYCYSILVKNCFLEYCVLKALWCHAQLCVCALVCSIGVRTWCCYFSYEQVSELRLIATHSLYRPTQCFFCNKNSLEFL